MVTGHGQRHRLEWQRRWWVLEVMVFGWFKSSSSVPCPCCFC
ncbi:hypothetical protein HanPSC8_Chr04g0145821 [Helianthus annuus]|nr:hypothetical protein HanLR1_Chr04g0128861 [Helianthus annuus]KAJ0930138.1 hypothetical protein HanPSC8_Chr04g0145821 [Helianthus annuus]